MRESLSRFLPKALGTYVNTLALIAPRSAARKAFAIFSKPRQGKVGVHHKDFLNPARDIKIQMGTLAIQTYVWEGSGPTVVLVHGWESHSHRYKSLVERLQQDDYTIVAFDAPAHGYSTGQRLYVPIYEVALQKVIGQYAPDYLIGHSMGGMTAIYSQFKNPNPRIKKMVILGSPDKLDDILDYYQQLLSLSNRAMQALGDYFKDRFGFFTKEFSTALFAEKINVPGLLIHEKSDRITLASGSVAIHEKWKNSKLILTEGLDHSLYSNEVNDTILKFLKEA